tara:strand:- start:241 stop:804 length:564 start_codon:yes stop_codon:yes gene_type:complete
MGVVAAMGCFVMGIVLCGPLAHFFNVPSILLVIMGTVGVFVFTHGRGSSQLLSAVVSWLFGADAEGSSPAVHKQLAAQALDFGQFALIVGAVGMVLGHVQMLQNLSDPSAIGPALAVSLLTLFYGTLINTLFAVPLSAHHLRLAGADAADFQHQNAGLRLLAVMGICTGVSFFVMLLAMGLGMGGSI